ncbi:MAG TPA: cell division protein FtsL [Bryobacterales bacterium]|nr:cell division protein FtsL [Bryobacterales bacterium]
MATAEWVAGQLGARLGARTRRRAGRVEPVAWPAEPGAMADEDAERQERPVAAGADRGWDAPAGAQAGPGAAAFFYDGVAAGREVRAGLSRRSAAVRPLPMEDLCFFAKSIDNSRLVRVVDPRSPRECLGLVACLSAVFILAVTYIVPCLLLLRTGYRVETLKKQNDALVESNRQLQVKEAVLRDPQRIYSIARGKLGLSEPAPEQVVWPEAGGQMPTGHELLARNASRNNKER